jgi:hypothetical protein
MPGWIEEVMTLLRHCETKKPGREASPRGTPSWSGEQPSWSPPWPNHLPTALQWESAHIKKLIEFRRRCIAGHPIGGYLNLGGGGVRMEPPDFRKFAEECLRLADRVESVEDKSVLLSMAQVWIRLADQGHAIIRLIAENDPRPS